MADNHQSSVNPLNLALRGKSKTVRLWWWSITVLDVIALIALITLAVLKFQCNYKSSTTHMKINHASFPAVTFCNLNPYKRSKLTADLTDLVTQYSALKSNKTESVDQSRKRKKRALIDCNCSVSPSPLLTAFDDNFSSKYMRLETIGNISWNCGFECCSSSKPSSIKSDFTRLAVIDNDAVANYLASKNILTETEAWFGLQSADSSGKFYWWNNANSQNSAVAITAFTSLCSTCDIFNSAYNETGPVAISRVQNATRLNILTAHLPNAMICEYVNAKFVATTTLGTASPPGVTSTRVKTACPTSTTTASTTQSTTSASIGAIPSSVSKSSSKATSLPSTAKSIQASTKILATPSSKPITATSPIRSRCQMTTTKVASSSTIASAATTTKFKKTIASAITTKCTSTKTTASTVSSTSLLATNTSTLQLTTSSCKRTKSTTTATPKLSTTSLPKTIGKTQITQAIQAMLDETRNDLTSSSATAEDAARYLVASLPLDVAIQLGYSAAEVIMDCIYNGVRCTLNDFTLNVNPNYGNCYTFNAKGDHPVALRPGAFTGLSVTYDVGVSQYLDYEQTMGVRVVVHDQGEPILPDVTGFDTAPGFQSSTSMTRIEINSLPLSSTPCANSPYDVQAYNYNESVYVTEVNQSNACLRSCYQKRVINNCQCGDPRVPLPRNGLGSFCDLTKRNCVNQNYVMDNSDEAVENCNCPAPCRMVNFETTQTTTKFSSGFKKYTSFLNLGNDASNSSNSNDFSKIGVYYESLLIVEYLEAKLYPLDSLLCDVSSIIGLALGASVMTLFEVIVLVKWCHKKCLS